MPKHAYLSASASHRWLACPPSAKLCANILDQASEYAQQGTDCHELCAYLVEKALGKDVIDPTENLTYYDAEMQNCAEEYRNYVLEQIEAAKEFCKDPQVMIEQRLDFSRWVENGFGTGDCVIVADEVLQIIDYKHGLGILVSAGDDEHGGNSQMIIWLSPQLSTRYWNSDSLIPGSALSAAVILNFAFFSFKERIGESKTINPGL